MTNSSAMPHKTRQEMHDDNVHTLAEAVIGRLAQRNRDAPRSAAVTPPQAVLDGFLAALLAGDAEGAIVHIESLSDTCPSYPALVDELFARAARRLGDAWADSSLSFLDVSLAISTLLRVNTRAKRRFFPHAVPKTDTGILFATLPGQAHTLGIVLASEAFRQAGYGVDVMLDSSPEAIRQAVRDRDVRLLGLTAGHSDRVHEILSIADRAKSIPRPPAIMVGGAAAPRIDDRGRSGRIDCVAPDLSVALSFAHSMSEKLEARV